MVPVTTFELDAGSLPPRLFGPRAAPYLECILFESAAETVAAAAFEQLADQLLPASVRAADTAIFAPEGETWRVADLEPVLRCMSLAPLHRKVVCLVSVHLMDRTLLDSLLKTIEEPASPTTLVCTAPSGSSLPATLRSRLLDTAAPRLVPPASFAERLAACAIPPALAARTDLQDLFVLLLAADEPKSCVAAARIDTPPPLAAASWITAVDVVLKGAAMSPALTKRLRPRFVRLFADLHLARLAGDASLLVADLDAVLYAAGMLNEASYRTASPAPYLTNLAAAIAAIDATPHAAS